MKTVLSAFAFLGVLALGREHAAIFAQRSGLGYVSEMSLTLAYYAALVTGTWLFAAWMLGLSRRFVITRIAARRAARTLHLLVAVCRVAIVAVFWIVVTRMSLLPGFHLVLAVMDWGLERRQRKQSSPKADRGASLAQKPLRVLLPTLFGMSLVPNGYWANVYTLRKRGTNVFWAVVWLAPSNALSYKVHYFLIALLKVLALTWLLNVAAVVVVCLLGVVLLLVAADLVRIVWKGSLRCLALLLVARALTRYRRIGYRNHPPVAGSSYSNY